MLGTFVFCLVAKLELREKDQSHDAIVGEGDPIPNYQLMEDEVLLQFYDIAAGKV